MNINTTRCRCSNIPIRNHDNLTSPTKPHQNQNRNQTKTTMPIDTGSNKGGAEGAVKAGTSTVCQTPLLEQIAKATSLTNQQVGNALGGITKTAGGLVGTAGRGVGETINNTTGTKAVGDGLQGITGGIEDGANSAGKGVENAGQGKKSW